MTTQHKPTGRASSIPSGLAMGAVISVLATFLICMIGAWLISSEILPQQKIGYCSVTALLASAILGALTSWRKIKRKRLMVCMLSGGVYFLLLVMTTVVFFGGDFRGMGVTFAVILMGSMAALLLTGEGRMGRTGRRYKKIRR